MVRSTYCVFGVVLALGILQPAADVLAQQDNALPDLAPREVEIRGHLEIAFPSLKRQPLIGFNPPPRIPEIPRTRLPFISNYKQESADLPPSPLRRPTPPRVVGLNTRKPVQAEIEAGAGRFFSRMIRANVGLPAGNRIRFDGNVDYRGSDGDSPFAGKRDLKSSFDALELETGLTTRYDQFSAGAKFDAFVDNYPLFGVNGPLSSIYVLDPDRRGHGTGGTLWLKTAAGSSVMADVGLRYGSSHFETDASSGTVSNDPTLERRERRIQFDGSFEAPTSAGTILASAHLSTAGLDASGFAGSTVQSLDIGGGFKVLHNGRYDLRIGVRVLGFTANGQSSSGGDRSGNYVTPDVRLDYYPRQGLSFYVQNSPGLKSNKLDALYRENPYLIDEPRVQPTVKTVDLESGAQVFAGGIQLTGTVGYERYPNYLFFEDATQTGDAIYSRGQSATGYANARILRAGAGIAASLSSELRATLGVTLRDGRLRDADVDIPYFATVVGDGMLSYSFAHRKGLFLVTSRVLSPRYRDRTKSSSGRVDTFVDLDLAASCDFTRSFGATLRLENIFGSAREEWDHYPQNPAVFSGSVRVRW